MRALPDHPWRKFEQDPQRHALAEALSETFKGRLGDLLGDAVSIGTGSYAEVLGLRSGTAGALGLALKVYKKDLQKSSMTPFAKQARMAGDVPSAPHIWGGENGHLLMDEIPGSPLSALPQLRELPRSAMLRVVRDGVKIVDELGSLTHRDMKPANFIVDPTGKSRIVDLDWMAHDSSPEDNAFDMGATLLEAATGKTLAQLLQIHAEEDCDLAHLFSLLNEKKAQLQIGEMLRDVIRDPVFLHVLLQLFGVTSVRGRVNGEVRNQLDTGAADDGTMRHTLYDYAPDYRKNVREWEDRMDLHAVDEGTVRRWLRRLQSGWEKLRSGK